MRVHISFLAIADCYNNVMSGRYHKCIIIKFINSFIKSRTLALNATITGSHAENIFVLGRPFLIAASSVINGVARLNEVL